MDRQSFFRSTSGHLFAGTATFALVAAGILALAGPGAHDIALPLIVLLCVVGCILSAGLSLEAAPGTTLVLVLTMPPVGGLYFAGLTVIGQLGAQAAIPLFTIAAVTGWLTVRGTPPVDASHTRTAKSPAHAH